MRNLGIEELKASNKEFDFTKQGPLNNIIEPPSDIIRERVVELLKAGRRVDARDAIQFGFRISRKQTNNMIEELLQEHVLK